MVWETEDTIDIILSVVITALGLIPLLNNYNIISFALPAIFSNTILVYAITLIAIYLIITGFRYYSDSVMKWPTLLVGGIVFLLGLANILGKFDVLNFAGEANFAIFMNIIYTLVGIFLLLTAFTYK
ncbi:hypothetical protein HOK68_00235 [Candidatus Woesearchaeota archaeon]|jgi:hypothetical protein|nr:hypothetical protein [Candidatus Woesearchaeota archaeon]MBT4387806.1 hypothetical protein [Candidatus Woesearchaeota archaeon]MBT4595625.1 hypothetical protein [Candidatus Woesearchaeota archaeon]MBT5740892.1 hypothetical protein [Candidatus Woesearchaeota archaeon]MBT6505189.1 hypothetical protein [Candidatus Woesearchaeota archaeon]